MLILFLIFKSIFTKEGVTNYSYVLLCCGILYGIRKMFVWIIPHGYDIGGTIGIIAFNFIIGGFIGIFVLGFQLLCVAWYIPVTIYRLIQEHRSSKYYMEDNLQG